MKDAIGWGWASVLKETCMLASSQAGDKNCFSGRGFPRSLRDG
jgi:hypothetical protein